MPEHAAQSPSKGSRVVVMGRLQQRTWTADDGSAPLDRGGLGEPGGRGTPSPPSSTAPVRVA
jgi:hypothetical protein